LTLGNIDIIDRFRPFGIGNTKPLFLLEDVTILESSPLGKEGKHLQIHIANNPHIKLLSWNPNPLFASALQRGNVVSLIVELERNTWNGKDQISIIIHNIIS
jgi:single-stranded-DNA-specific exonuclease